MIYAMATGCSHTAGTGNNIADCYVSVLEKSLELPIHNQGTPGGNCDDVMASIVRAVQSTQKPKFIIAQWPNPFRRTAWINNKKHLQNINNCDQSFMMLLKNGEENFYEPWIQDIVIGNLLAQQVNVSMINIMLENINQQYHDRLAELSIKLYVDEKLPGRSWLFDSNADDKIHHSPMCHQQWANRLMGLIDEYTAR